MLSLHLGIVGQMNLVLEFRVHFLVVSFLHRTLVLLDVLLLFNEECVLLKECSIKLLGVSVLKSLHLN